VVRVTFGGVDKGGKKNTIGKGKEHRQEGDTGIKEEKTEKGKIQD